MLTELVLIILVSLNIASAIKLDCDRDNKVPLDQLDSKLYAFCNTIRQDLGIKETVSFYGYSTDSSGKDTVSDAFYHRATDSININLNVCNRLSPQEKIRMIAHELGHYLQAHDDPKSYRCKDMLYQLSHYNLSHDESVEIRKKMEIGAEANAYGFLDCKKCLQECWFKYVLLAADNPFKNDYLKTQGYFGEEDILPFVQRAELDGQLCPMHAHTSFLVLSMIADCQDCIEFVLAEYENLTFENDGLRKQDFQQALQEAKITGKRCAEHAKHANKINTIVSNSDFLRKVLEVRYVDDEQIFAGKCEAFTAKEATYTEADFLPHKDRSSYQQPYVESKLDFGRNLEK